MSHNSNQPTAELERLLEKLAFYEQPITTFDRPVENDPTELLSMQHVRVRDVAVVPRDPKQRKIDVKREQRPCLLAQLVRRSMAAMRKWLSPRRAAQDARVPSAMHAAKQSAALKTLHGYGRRDTKRDKRDAIRARTPTPRRRFHEMDESTRFRLELAGIRVQSEPPSYTVCV